MNNCFPISRDVLDKFRPALPEGTYANLYLLMLHLLIHARHKDGFAYGVPLKRGQLLRSRHTLSIETGLSEQQIRTALKNLICMTEVNVEKARNLTTKITNKANVITCLNYDSWCMGYSEYNQINNHEVTRQQPDSNHKQEGEEGKEGEELQSLKPMSASADMPPQGELPTVSDNGKAKTQDIQAIASHYQTKIHSGARLIDKAKDKIRVRLSTYPKDELLRAIDLFASDAWWMENNARRGMAWFFKSDDRIEQFLGIVPRETDTGPKRPSVYKIMSDWAEREDRKEAEERDKKGI